MRDIVGLYLNPPHHALVLCVDEKSQIQALSRSQPILPMLPGQVERRTHDYKLHGTTSLFAALDIATGSVIGKCWPRHRAIEFRKFLNQIDRAVPADLTVHLVLEIMPPTRPGKFGRGSCGILATICTSLPRQFLAEPSGALVRLTVTTPDQTRFALQRA